VAASLKDPETLLGRIVKFWNKPRHRKRKALRDLAERHRLLEPFMRLRAHAAYATRHVRRRRQHGLPGPLVVSLTSYPPRFPTLHLTLMTLLSQQVLPDRVVLYVFDEDHASLPRDVLALAGDLLDIRRVPTDIRSYKKLVPALGDFPQAFIATADDDVRYRSTWLGELVSAHDPAVREVIGRRAHRIRTDASGMILPYRDWEQRVESTIRADPSILLTGVGGILYPPGVLSPMATDESSFMRLCPSADDVWFYFMARLTGAACRKIGQGPKDYYWEPSQGVALSAFNVEGSGNDEAFARMVERFGNPLNPGFGGRMVDHDRVSG
jgi:hypothetical protein